MKYIFRIRHCLFLIVGYWSNARSTKFGVRSESDVYVRDKDIEVTGQPIQTAIVPILKGAVTPRFPQSLNRR